MKDALQVEASATAASAFVAAFVAFVRPFTAAGRRKRHQNKMMKLWFSGADAVDGISPRLEPAPIQLATLQSEVRMIAHKVDQILDLVSPGEDAQ